MLTRVYFTSKVKAIVNEVIVVF